MTVPIFLFQSGPASGGTLPLCSSPLELSRSTWVATSLAPGSKKMSKHTLVGGDGRKLLDLPCAVEDPSRATHCSAGQGCGDPRSRARWFLDSSLARGQRRREPRRRSCVDCRASTPPARQDGCDRRRDAAAHADGLAARRAALLMRLKGIGAEFATVLYFEGLFRHFENRRQLAAYAGLAPSPWKSGSIDHEQGISKAGNPRLRTTMVELAWMWVRYQPDSALSCWFRQRVGSERGRIRRISIVALARKLLIALSRYINHGEIPAGAVVKPD